LVLGILLAGLLFVAEIAEAGRDALSALGSPPATVLAVYLTFGAVVGAVTGAIAGLVARGKRRRFAPVQAAVLTFIFAALFILRRAYRVELVALTPATLTVVGVGAIIAVATIWWTRKRNPGDPGPARRGRDAAIAACALALWGGALLGGPLRHQRVSAPAGAPADAPNVLFILVDALRVDRLSTFGYSRPTSPNLDRLAASGTVFTRAYSQGNRTIIAMPSLFTSLYPAFTGASGFQDQLTPLPESRTTIAELCRDAGYATVGMMSNIYVKRPFGLTQGFGRVEEFNPGRFRMSIYRVLIGAGLIDKPQYAAGSSASAKEVTDAALRWLERTPGDAPFFCYVHYMDVHHPYLPPPEYERMFRSREDLEGIDPVALFRRTAELVRAQRRYGLGEADLARLSDLYDGCIRYVDTEMGRLIDAAQRPRNGRPTVIVFTSDHGDEFQEQGCLYHNNLVIEELIRVPLVIWRSDVGRGRRVDDLVRHVDVLPTIAEWVGAAAPEAVAGRSLAPAVNGGESVAATESIAEGDYCAALVEPGWKVMRVDTTDTYQLFELDAVALASRPLEPSPAHADRFARMRADLDEYMASVDRAGGKSVTATAETLRQLESLGYIRR
jgi:arylsulfatase A-like enzyme